MSEVETMEAQPRERAGKGAARAVRRAGMVPAVIYGAKKPPISISLETRMLERILGRPGFFSTLYDVEVDGAKHRTLPRDVQVHPVTDKPLHVDFLRVSADTKMSEACELMSRGNFRHLPIARGKECAALLQVRHLNQYLAELFPQDVLALPPDIHQVLAVDGG